MCRFIFTFIYYYYLLDYLLFVDLFMYLFIIYFIVLRLALQDLLKSAASFSVRLQALADKTSWLCLSIFLTCWTNALSTQVRLYTAMVAYQ